MGQQRFVVIKPGAKVIAGGIIEEIQEGLFVFGVGQEAMWTGILLPESTQISDLPAFDRFGTGFVASVGSEPILDRPTTNAGAVGLKVEAAMEFAGGGTVR